MPSHETDLVRVEFQTGRTINNCQTGIVLKLATEALINTETSFLKMEIADVSILYYWHHFWHHVYLFIQLPYIAQAVVYIAICYNVVNPELNGENIPVWLVSISMIFFIWEIFVETAQIKADGVVYFTRFYNQFDTFVILAHFAVLVTYCQCNEQKKSTGDEGQDVFWTN